VGANHPIFLIRENFVPEALAILGKLFAEKLQMEEKFEGATVVFGSAYKGIPISVVTSVALADTDRAGIRSVSDRKEAKTHGDASAFSWRPEIRR